MIFRKEPDILKNNEALRTLIVLASNTLFIVLAFFSEKTQKKQGRISMPCSESTVKQACGCR